MAYLWNIILCAMVISVICVHGSPIKRTATATEQHATECNGTDCYYSPDYLNTDTVVNVNFPGNLTQIVSMTLPLIPDMMEQQNQQIQSLTAIMGQLMTLFSEMLPVLPVLPVLPPPSPRDCQDVATAGSFYRSGIYDLKYGAGTIQVYCDLDTSSGGWTVFQRRFDGTVDFFLGWSEYVSGFGNVDGEYWLGLSHIHRMTRSGQWQLRIDMEAFDGDTAYALYDSFSIGDASSNYQLHIGEYSGTAGDSLTWHNNMEFSTKDRDNDARSGSNCAQTFKGSWWYNDCHNVNLNALYLGPSVYSVTVNRWYHWKGIKSLKMTEMKMRRVA